MSNMTQDDKSPRDALVEEWLAQEGPSGTNALRGFQTHAGLDIKSISLWATSPERSWYLARRRRIVLRWVSWLLFLFLVALVLGVYFSTQDKTTWGSEDETWFGWSVLAAAASSVGLLWCAAPYWAARRAFRERTRATAAYRVDVALKEVTKLAEEGKDNLPLNGLFELNRRQLDEYQEMTKRQQHVAFQLTWAAAILAFLVLILGVALSLKQDNGTAQYVVAGLTGLGTLLSGFLGKTFFDQHSKAMDQLNRYFREPSATGRLLAAERLSRNLDEPTRQECVKAMVERLLAPDEDDETTDANGAEKKKGKKEAPDKAKDKEDSSDAPA